MKHFTTSVAEHVAGREAERFMNESMREADMVKAVKDSMDDIWAVFKQGRRLDHAQFEAVANLITETIEASNPYRMERYERKATRMRPNSEALEILAVTHVQRGDETGFVPMLATRAWLTRKKFVFEVSMAGGDITHHLLSRAMERHVVGDQGLAEIGQTMVDALGLWLIWHHAYTQVRLPYSSIAIPHDGGLLLGRLSVVAGALNNRLTVGRDWRGSSYLSANDFLSVPEDESGYMMRCSRIGTVISVDMMTRGQVFLHAALSGFMDRNREVLAEIGRCMLWPGAELEPNPSFEQSQPVISVLMDELVDLLSDVDVEQALRASHESLQRQDAERPQAPSLEDAEGYVASLVS